MITETYISIGILLLGIAMSALYSGLETGLYTINQIRLEVKANAGWANARRMIMTLRNPTRMLAVLLVSNNIANFLASYGAARLLNATELGPLSEECLQRLNKNAETIRQLTITNKDLRRSLLSNDYKNKNRQE